MGCQYSDSYFIYDKGPQNILQSQKMHKVDIFQRHMKEWFSISF